MLNQHCIFVMDVKLLSRHSFVATVPIMTVFGINSYGGDGNHKINLFVNPRGRMY